MSPRAILIAARAVIAEPGRLAVGTFARDDGGLPVLPRSDRACCWCALGAIFKAAGGETEEKNKAVRLLNVAVYAEQDRRGVPHASIATYSDDRSTTHANVLARFDEAIALAPEGS